MNLDTSFAQKSDFKKAVWAFLFGQIASLLAIVKFGGYHELGNIAVSLTLPNFIGMIISVFVRGIIAILACRMLAWETSFERFAITAISSVLIFTGLLSQYDASAQEIPQQETQIQSAFSDCDPEYKVVEYSLSAGVWNGLYTMLSFKDYVSTKHKVEDSKAVIGKVFADQNEADAFFIANCQDEKLPVYGTEIKGMNKWIVHVNKEPLTKRIADLRKRELKHVHKEEFDVILLHD